VDGVKVRIGRRFGGEPAVEGAPAIA
jgi:hypothetical protein